MEPTTQDLVEAANVFAVMDAVRMGAQDFGHLLSVLDADYAEQLMGVLERELALKNPPEIRVFAGEKTLTKSVA